MAAGVVDPLEVVDVEHQHADRLTVAAGEVGQRMHGRLQAATIVQAGQVIGQGMARGVGVDPPEALDRLAQQRQHLGAVVEALQHRQQPLQVALVLLFRDAVFGQIVEAVKEALEARIEEVELQAQGQHQDLRRLWV